MSAVTSGVCPYCQSAIQPVEASITCRVCGIPHHEDCWTENGGCTTFGCTASPMSGPQPQYGYREHDGSTYWNPDAPIDITLDDLSMVCPQCGELVEIGAQYCNNCGSHYSYNTSYKNPITACLLNLLLLGAGYFYLGQVGKGIKVLLISVAAGCFTYGIGTIIYAMVDCYNTAVSINRSSC